MTTIPDNDNPTSLDARARRLHAAIRTVLARAVQAAGFTWKSDEAHSAVYDAERTAELFCRIANAWARP